MNTCATCARRSAEPVNWSVRSNAQLYGCEAINKTPRVYKTGAGSVSIEVRADFGCVLWRERAAKPSVRRLIEDLETVNR